MDAKILKPIKKVLGLLGLCGDRPTKLERDSCGTIIFSFGLKFLILLVDFLSSALDWRIAFNLLLTSNELFSIDGASDAPAIDENIPQAITALTGVFIGMILLGTGLYLRGKWLYLQTYYDWGSFAMTEVVLYTMENTAAIILYILVNGLYDNQRFLDQTSVLLSNISGYLVLMVLYGRLCILPLVWKKDKTNHHLLEERVPRSIWIFLPLITLQVVLVSVTSYLVLLGGATSLGDIGEESWVFPLSMATASIATITLVWILLLFCSWRKCMEWSMPDEGEERDDGRNFNSLRGFLVLWGLYFGTAMLLGWICTRWEPIYTHSQWALFSGGEFIGARQQPELPSSDLYFGYSVYWSKMGDKNGRGSSILVGAQASTVLPVTMARSDKGNSTANAYAAVISLAQQSATGWDAPRVILDGAFLVDRALAGFLMNASGTYGFAKVGIYTAFGSALTNNSVRNLAVASGGTEIKLVYNHIQAANQTEGSANGTVIANTANSRRFITGFPYEQNNTGSVRVYQPWVLIDDYGNQNDTSHAFQNMQFVGQEIWGTFVGEEFGFQVSMGDFNSSRLAIASRNRAGANNSGSITFWEYSNSTDLWTTFGSPLIGDETNDLFAHSMEMSASGERIIVGAPAASNGEGSAYVYEWRDNQWQIISGKIIPEFSVGPVATAHFGYAVSISGNGDRIAIAGETGDSSLVYTYELSFDETTKEFEWTLLKPVLVGAPGNFAAGYENSLRLDSSGNFLIFGDVGSDSSKGLGRVRVFQYAKQI